MSEITDDLRAQAEELGIPIRGRMTAETLQQRIDNVLGGESEEKAAEAAPKAKEPETMVEVLMLKVYRRADEESDKIAANLKRGQIVYLPEAEAKRCVKNRIATRDTEIDLGEGVVKSWAAHDGYTD